LTLRDYEPLAATTGAQALRMAREQGPALVLAT
jgi:hypothetical protein